MTSERGHQGGVGPARVLVVLAGFLILGVVGVTFSLVVGPTSIDLDRALSDPTSFDAKKVFTLRLPRALTAFVVGGALAAAGVIFQALIRNPLASPYILGVSAGGSFGAVVAIALGFAVVPLAAFAGACGAIILVYSVARTQGRVPSSTLLLSGVIVNSFFAAAIMLVNILVEPRNQDRILRWLVGGFGDAQQLSQLSWAASATLAGGLLGFALSRELNLVALGDIVAERSGVAVARTRTILYLLGSLLTAVAVSLSGPIGFVGLIVPHLLRLILGPDHRVLVPASLFAGGTFLCVVDTLAQTVWKSPLPAGVLTAFLGGPLFLMLLKRRDRARAGLDG